MPYKGSFLQQESYKMGLKEKANMVDCFKSIGGLECWANVNLFLTLIGNHLKTLNNSQCGCSHNLSEMYCNTSQLFWPVACLRSVFIHYLLDYSIWSCSSRGDLLYFVSIIDQDILFLSSLISFSVFEP